MASEENRSTERRKHKRYRVKGNIFAALGSNSPKIFGKIVDLSRGGLAFHYTDSDARRQEPLDLDILCVDDGILVDKMAATTVADFEIANEIPFQMVTRRRAVQFGPLTADQTAKLEYFLQNNSLVE